MADIYSGGFILFCTERQVGAVIVVFLTSASQLLCMCVTLVVRRWSSTTNRAALLCIFFQRVDIILGMWVPGYSSLFYFRSH